jgi:hypothetical protein
MTGFDKTSKTGSKEGYKNKENKKLPNQRENICKR